MDTISITSKNSIPLDDVRSRIESHLRLVDGGPDQLVIEESNGRVYIYHPQQESGEVALNQVFLDYSSVDLVKKIIEIIANDSELTVENDFGTVLPGNQFVARIRSEREWDWRR